MEKEQNNKTDEKVNNKKEIEAKTTPEDKIKELEDKLARTLAEMENQRRRFEKEKKIKGRKDQRRTTRTRKTSAHLQRKSGKRRSRKIKTT